MAAPVSPRPKRIKFSGHTADDGLFGPDSVTWRISALPQLGLAAHGAAMLQMLLPPVMHMIDQASTFRTNPASRAELTALFGRTLTYGDTAAANRAAEVLAKIHHRVTATDPVSARTYHADEPDLLLWVHNTLQWMVLRVTDSYGPALSDANKSTYLNEQVIAARLTGCTVDDVPTTEKDLSAYIEGMTPRLAMGSDTIWFKKMVFPARIVWRPATYLPHMMGVAVAGLLNYEQRQLYGVDRPAWQFETNRKILKGIFEAEARKVPVLSRISLERQKVDEKAFGSPH
ncbi:MAG: oxygenase MpaB family protein [Mycolicibacterium sp.]|uniref:oxygenase MpaB family protein n=1 Tax=Mycolicibacterium sp. TaxID=2320850 RepID=UPI003D0DECE8